MISNLYTSTVTERKNGFFIGALAISAGLIAMITTLLSTLVFYERYQSEGIVTSSLVVNMGVEHGGLIKENNIIAGRHYAKGDVLLSYDRQEESLQQRYLQKKYKILSAQKERIKGSVSLLEIEALELKMNDVKHELSLLERIVHQKSLIMPFDGVIVSGAVSDTPFNRVTPGEIVAKAIESATVVLSVEPSSQWIGKIKPGDRVLIRYNADKHESRVLQLASVEREGKIVVSALIEIPTSLLRYVQVGTSLRATIYTEKINFTDVFLRALSS